jgi:hypothetical protein
MLSKQLGHLAVNCTWLPRHHLFLDETRFDLIEIEISFGRGVSRALASLAATSKVAFLTPRSIIPT